MMKTGKMRRLFGLLLALVLCQASVSGLASGYWSVPNNGGSGSSAGYSSIQARLTDDLATRSGPSTQYTGCGSYKMKGQTVTVLSRAYDNGGVLWVEVEFAYGGGYRRAWTGAKRLNLSTAQLNRLPEEDMIQFLGYGTVNSRTTPRFGPGSLYSTYGDRDLYSGDRVVVIDEVNGYYKVECYYSNGEILRSWVPAGNVYID